MQSKAPLSLMEQVIMILVFALAAAVCLQGFSVASNISHSQENRNQAVLVAQNYAEQLKNASGDYEKADISSLGYWNDSVFLIPYNDSWKPDTGNRNYILQITPLETENPLLGSAQIQVLSGQHILFEIRTAWQEVDNHETD